MSDKSHAQTDVVQYQDYSVDLERFEKYASERALGGIGRTDTKLTPNDLAVITVMARNFTSPRTIATALGLLESDLYSPENEGVFRARYEQSRAIGIAMLQKTQVEVGVHERNPQMLIHLGKVYAGQEETVNINQRITDVTTLSLEEIARKLEADK